ncbi:MAG TPA: hypothetical protein VJL29_05790 [Thermoguttaceae bacterium]|nr:hypothetical protein [Thermoguttaceae bacterium]
MKLTTCDGSERCVEPERPVDEPEPGHGGKRNHRTRPWRHPSKPHIKVPYRVAAAIALMEMGISDYAVIAGAVGMTVEEVERVDMVEDPAIRQLALAGIPAGESFRLSRRVRCPKCQAKVGLAPCIACHSYRRNHSTTMGLEI